MSSAVGLLNERLMTLIDAMPAAQAGDVRSVHQARVATRRLRETLPVVRAATSHHTLNRVQRQVRRMTRALGPVRELDVAISHLDELGARQVVSSRALSRVRQALVRQRLSSRRDMLAAITPGKVERLRHRLDRVSAGPQKSAPDAPLREAAHQVARRARRLAAAIDHAGGVYLPDRLHAARIAAKKLRYALEVERELRRSRATARISQLKRLQDVLGDVHDLEILIERTREVQAELAGSDRKMTSELDTLVRTLEAEARQAHAAYMQRRASIVRLCEALLPTEQMRASAVA